MMIKQRLISLVLVLVAVFVVSCGGPSATVAPPTYTQIQLERIQGYIPGILEAHERFGELESGIQAEDWQEVQAVMRGPLGQMLQDMNSLTRNLLPKDQQAARQAARNFFDDLVDIDQAAEGQKVDVALLGYTQALKDFDEFMQLIPTSGQAS